MPATFPGRLLVAALISSAIALSGCSSWRHRGDETAPLQKLYERAHKLLANGDYGNAVKVYESLDARYPFSDQARQGRIDIMFAYYKSDEKESAVDAADDFIRENPTHPRVDYAWYIKGLVYFARTPNLVERWFHADLTQRPPQDARKSFDAFHTLVQRYPNSRYAHDARMRMVYLRDRLADYEVHVADFYLRRKAYVASLDRAKYCIENYDGAPAVQQALSIMVSAYKGMGLNDLAEQTQKVYALNFPNQKSRREKRHWYQIW